MPTLDEIVETTVRAFGDTLYGNHAGETRVFMPGLSALDCMEAELGNDGIWTVMVQGEAAC